MKKAIKWIGIGLGAILIIILISAFYLKSVFENDAKRNFNPVFKTFEIPSDSSSLERGKLLAVSCRGCHGNDFAGLDFFNDPTIGYLSSPNLTPAAGSSTEKYEIKDWIRTLRHGVKPDGHPVLIMPSENVGQLSDEDLGCLIAYLRSVPPVIKPAGPRNFTFFAKVLAGAGQFGSMYPYDVIKHDEVHTIIAPAKADTKEYGAYLSRFHGCPSCHGKLFNGGLSPDPISPPGSNITGGGNPGKWTADQFRETMRSGKTPEGKILDPKFMPWVGIGAHEDVELDAIFTYIKSLPPLPNSEELEDKLKSMKK